MPPRGPMQVPAPCKSCTRDMTNTKLQHLDDLGFEWRSYDGRWYGEEMGCNPPKFGFHWT